MKPKQTRRQLADAWLKQWTLAGCVLTLWWLLLLLSRSRQVLLLLQDEERGHTQLALHRRQVAQMQINDEN